MLRTSISLGVPEKSPGPAVHFLQGKVCVGLKGSVNVQCMQSNTQKRLILVSPGW